MPFNMCVSKKTGRFKLKIKNFPKAKTIRK